MRPQAAGTKSTGWSRLQRLARTEAGHVRAFCYRQMMRFGPRRLSRDIRLVHAYLTDLGRAVWLGDPFPDDRPSSALECRTRAVARVRGLFAVAAAETTTPPQASGPPAPRPSPPGPTSPASSWLHSHACRGASLSHRACRRSEDGKLTVPRHPDLEAQAGAGPDRRTLSVASRTAGR